LFWRISLFLSSDTQRLDSPRGFFPFSALKSFQKKGNVEEKDLEFRRTAATATPTAWSTSAATTATGFRTTGSFEAF
jgi:hypothetical protein